MHWDRARALWREWDEATRQGRPPTEILSRLTDEQIIDLLMALDSDRRYERDVLAAEAHNRLVRRRRELRQIVREATESVERVVRAMLGAWPEVVATERDAREVLESDDSPSAQEVADQTKLMHGLVGVVRETLGEASAASERLRDFERAIRLRVDMLDDEDDG